MSDLKVAMVQTQQYWEDKKANLQHFDTLLTSELHESIDVLIFPEMFHTGFTMNAKNLAENMEDSLGLIWLKTKAKKHDCLCIASLIIEEQGKYFNRMVAVHPEGKIDYYDKIHLFSLAKEDEHYSPGTARTKVEFRGWKLLLQVCYDLRFPENSRNSVQKDGSFEFDAIIYVANWPERRVAHWDALLPARAIENQCYVIAVNRVGQDANSLTYNGSSQVIDALGFYVVEPFKQIEAINIGSLTMKNQEDIRQKLPFLKDRKANSGH
jgi:predicted amidohydrolase